MPMPGRCPGRPQGERKVVKAAALVRQDPRPHNTLRAHNSTKKAPPRELSACAACRPAGRSGPSCCRGRRSAGTGRRPPPSAGPRRRGRRGRAGTGSIRNRRTCVKIKFRANCVCSTAWRLTKGWFPHSPTTSRWNTQKSTAAARAARAPTRT